MTSLPPLNPYPGLRPFRESEAHLFFGRSAHVDEVLAELDRSRFVAVMGASASGKSSLVYAGVLPALHGGFSPRAGSRWRIASLRPGANPIHHLARALAVPGVLGVEEPDPVFAAAQVEATLRRSGLGSRRRGAAEPGAFGRPAAGGRRPVRGAVPLREHGWPDRARRRRRPLRAAARSTAAEDDHAPVDVIITMRSDFLGDCSRLRDLPEAVNHGLYLVPRLTRSQLAEAITAPAAVGGATMSHRLVQRLLNDAGGDPDMLPVLQHALMRTWDIWGTETSWAPDGSERGPIDIDHYEACGGVRDALSRHADEAYFELADDRARGISELMFKRITELGDDHREVRRPTSLVEIAAVAGATTAELTQCIEPLRGAGTVVRDRLRRRHRRHLPREPHPPMAPPERVGEPRSGVARRLHSAGQRGQPLGARRGSPPPRPRSPDRVDAGGQDPAQRGLGRALPPGVRHRGALSRREPDGGTATSGRRRGRCDGPGRPGPRRRAPRRVGEPPEGPAAAGDGRSRAPATNSRRPAAGLVVGRRRSTAARSRSVLAAVEAVQATDQDGVRLPVADEALRQAHCRGRSG